MNNYKMQERSSFKLFHSRILQAISLFLLAALFSCGQNGEDVTRAEIAHQWSGHYAEVKLPAAMAGDRETWENVWDLLREPMPEWPEETEAFAVFYAGQRPTGGYGMEAEIAYQDRNVIRVRCSLHPPDGPATTALTYPWKIVVLSGVDGREVEVQDWPAPGADLHRSDKP